MTSESQKSKDLPKILEFIASNGGHWSRWSSLTIFGGAPTEHPKVIKQISTKSMPYLSVIYFQPEPNLKPRGEHETGELTDDWSFEPNTHPQLVSVVLLGLPYCLVRRPRDKLLASRLQQLWLACDRVLYPREGLIALLSSSTQLESLHLDTGSVGQGLRSDRFAPPLRVLLPSLRTISLKLTTSAIWGFTILRAIDAPAVETFQLMIDLNRYAQCLAFTLELNETAAIDELACFVASGRLNGFLQETPTKHYRPGAGPIFPSLRTLILLAPDFEPGVYATLLKVYSGVTKAMLDSVGINLLGRSGKFLPNLTHLRCMNDSSPAAMARIKNAVKNRKEWSVQLSSLELVTPATGCSSEGWRTAQKVHEDFGYAMRDGLTVWKFGSLLLNPQGPYDMNDYSDAVFVSN
ncbi:hypothetical protein FRC07_006139 [Ceratobasidium sp. 392]|nr:hypothetical protein FRC07_006139 [Ceratobasidium sp. 392]